jgi:hypothetical protein
MNFTPHVLLGPLLFANPAWDWFAEGHQSVAVISAGNLTPTARSRVAQIPGVPVDMGWSKGRWPQLQYAVSIPCRLL